MYPQNRQSPAQLPGSCYRCHKPGHWANSCPDNPHTRSPILQPITFDDEFPAAHCRCGAGWFLIKVSKSQQNNGRKYYICPGINEMHCDFYKWCDKLSMEDMREVQPGRYPMCGCGAGVCHILVEQTGINAGRSYYACRIRKGDGACNFKQWVEEYSPQSPESISVTPENPIACQSSILDELDDFELSYEAECSLMLLRYLPLRMVFHMYD